MTEQKHWLLEIFAEYESKPAMIWHEREVSYSDLLAQIKQWGEELGRSEVQPGEVVAFQGDYSPNICALFLALVANKNIAVPLTSSAAKNNDEFFDTARVSLVIDFDEDDTWTLRRRTLKLDPHPLIEQLRGGDKSGLVLFSSGSTGKAKGVLHDFDLVLSNIKKKGRRSWRSLIFLLLDHIGGVNTLMNILRNGGTAVSLDDRSPDAVCKTIERHKVQLVPTSPTFLNMLLISRLYEKYDLSSLELVTYGTERMADATLRAVGEALPDVRLKQTYGMSELGIMATKSRDSKSLWMKIGGDVETRIVDRNLWIRTDSPMLGYLNAPSPFDEDGWFNTEDEVEVDGDFIRILGRQSDIINVGGEKVYPAEVESVLLEMDNIKDVTVIGRSNPVTGQVVAAVVQLDEPEAPRDLKRRIWKHCEGRLTRSQMPMVVSVDDALEISDRIKKVRRKGD